MRTRRLSIVALLLLAAAGCGLPALLPRDGADDGPGSDLATFEAGLPDVVGDDPAFDGRRTDGGADVLDASTDVLDLAADAADVMADPVPDTASEPPADLPPDQSPDLQPDQPADPPVDQGGNDAGGCPGQIVLGEGTGAQVQNVITDTYVRESSPNSSSGSAAGELGVRSDVGNVQDALIRIDLPTTLAGCTVAAAELILTVTNNTNAPARFYAVTEKWDASATWNVARTGVAWSKLGCHDPPCHDTAEAAVATFTVAQTQRVPLATALVQAWLDDPQKNLGLVVTLDSTTNGLGFASSEASDPATRPLLHLTFQ